MPVTHAAEVAICRGFGCFLKLLLRWRGSIYKLIWPDLAAFLSLYYILHVIYGSISTSDQKHTFEAVVQYCATYINLIPLSWVLGIYVSIVMKRWWDIYRSIPWPDSVASSVSTYIDGQDEGGRVMRRTLMRYVCLCLTMVLTNVSPRVKKRFPTLDNLIEAGLLVENERKIIDMMNKKYPQHSKHGLPIVWADRIARRARKEGRIQADFALKTIIDEVNNFREKCDLLLSYNTIGVPLVYTQVVITLAVYSYCLTSAMGQQWAMIDLYFPIFPTLQFFLYMGWLKVAESLINPFGDDDDDFEVNWMIDRNLQVSYMIVDEMHHEHPELIED